MVALADQFQIVVDGADGAETDGHDQHRPDITVPEIGPQKGTDGEGEENDDAAHGGGALFGQQVVLWPIGADRLAILLMLAQPSDHDRSDDEADDQRGDDRAAGPEGNVAEQVEDADLIGQGIEKVI